MKWVFKSFDELSNKEFHGICKERVAVFVVEQNCAYQEIDDDDLIATHIFKTEGENLLAYCRVIPCADGVHLGRVLTVAKGRGAGLGREMLAAAINFIRQNYKGVIHAQAQTHLEKFYASVGFRAISESYWVDNIPHTDMVLKI